MYQPDPDEAGKLIRYQGGEVSEIDMEDWHEQVKAGELLAGFTSTAVPFGVIKEINGTYAGSQSRFVPVGTLSINQAGKKRSWPGNS